MQVVCENWICRGAIEAYYILLHYITLHYITLHHITLHHITIINYYIVASSGCPTISYQAPSHLAGTDFCF